MEVPPVTRSLSLLRDKSIRMQENGNYQYSVCKLSVCD